MKISLERTIDYTPSGHLAAQEDRVFHVLAELRFLDPGRSGTQLLRACIPVHARADFDDAAEGGGEVALAGESQPQRDLRDGKLRVAEADRAFKGPFACVGPGGGSV